MLYRNHVLYFKSMGVGNNEHREYKGHDCSKKGDGFDATLSTFIQQSTSYEMCAPSDLSQFPQGAIVGTPQTKSFDYHLMHFFESIKLIRPDSACKTSWIPSESSCCSLD
jgi:hypothetical protein